PKSRLLAVDFGGARTGLAATDWTGTIAVPLPRIDSRDPAEVVRQVLAVAAERDTEGLVVGVPLALDGGVGERAQRTLEFVAALRAATDLDVATIDESHTTDEAHERLKAFGMKAKRRKDFADSVAALVILERYRQQLRPRA
ncbi:MAG TPA: Holliday junction resolvase RuvX, partial [bacterium]|nr:Holliday junction resolvase RuvX [bacterium]